MKQKDFGTISIEDFKQNEEYTDYVDDDFVLIDSLNNIPDVYGMAKLECFLMVICREGSIRLEIDNIDYTLNTGDVLLGQPGALIKDYMMTPDNQISLVGFSSRFMRNVVKAGKKSWNVVVSMYSNPFVPSDTNTDFICRFTSIRQLISEKLEDTSYFQQDVIRHLFSAILYDLLGLVCKRAVVSNKENIHDDGFINQSDYILYRFIQLLSQDNGTHRTVTYFADLLCYSPKHLCKAVKEASGRTPLDLIKESVTERIKYSLKYSNKSIKEIAAELDFPNPSFFGKYVKARLGLSPANYRNQILNK